MLFLLHSDKDLSFVELVIMIVIIVFLLAAALLQFLNVRKRNHSKSNIGVDAALKNEFCC
jgi:hypothetical protein